LRFIKTIAVNFVKTEYLSDEKIVNLNVYSPYVLLPIEKLIVGQETCRFIENFDKNFKNQFLLKCLQFYQKAVQKSLRRFPLTPFLKNLQFIEPRTTLNANSDIDITKVVTTFKCASSDQCIREYNQLKVYFSDEEKNNLLATDVISFWVNLKNVQNYNDEHGNADVKRVFSLRTDVKTKKRNKLSTDMLSAIIRIKMDLLDSDICCVKYVFNDNHFKLYNIKMYDFQKKNANEETE
jgi:hypothetical protein